MWQDTVILDLLALSNTMKLWDMPYRATQDGPGGEFW